jgi:hypothetical protein
MTKIKLGDKVYDTSSLTGEAQKLATALKVLEERIQEANNMMAILTKAKRAYIADLKTEMLSAKAGFDFTSD